MTLPSPAHTGNKTSTLRGHVLPCLKLFLGSCRPWHEVQLCLSLGFCRLPPPPRPFPAPASPAVGLAGYSGPLCLRITSSVCNASPLPCLAELFIHLGLLYLLPFAGSLDPSPILYLLSPACPPPTKCLPKTLAEGCGGTGGEPHLGSSPCVCAQVQP